MIFAPAILRPGIFRNAFGVGRFASPSDTDELSLDLQFAADKTLTARRGPTPTFTRASTATFVGSDGLIQSAAINAPRFDHDPVTLACKGLLIEESRTNLFSSTNLNDWAVARATKTAITGIGLTNQATTLTISELGSAYLVRTVTLTTGVAYAISLRAKAGTVPSFSITDLTGGKTSRAFNLLTGQWSASGGAVEFTNYTVTPNIDGWFLVSVIYTPTGATGTRNIAFPLNSTIIGQTASFDTPQIEAGSFPTSFIPTTTASVVRSADVCSITGSDFTGFWNQSEGSFACNYSIPVSFTGNRYAASIEDTVGGTQNGFAFRNTNSATSFIAGAGYVSAIGAVTTTTSKHILAYSGLTEFVYVKDSVIGTTTGSGTRDPSLPIRMSIGSLEGSFQVCGHIAVIRYYKKRLPDAKLQSLTS